MSRWICGLCAFFLAATGSARPVERTAEGEDDDARVFLTVLDQAIDGDVRSFCRVRVLVVGTEVEFAEGDSVTVYVTEDDLVGNDRLWSHDFDVTAAEIEAQRVDRTFDCHTEFGGDVGGNLEVFAGADVQKAGCGLFCLQDTPNTPGIDVREVQDDGAEDDDAAGDARPLPLGLTTDRIGRDPDWHEITLLDRSRVIAHVLHDTATGRLDATLVRPDGDPAAAGQAGEDGTVIESPPVPPGRYRIRVAPQDARDYNFYDIQLRVQTVACDPGAVEEEPCGHCGTRRRTCDERGEWGAFGECVDPGVCEPGEMRMEPCGRCGTVVERCTAQCQWERSACEGEGVCQPGDLDVVACEGGGQRQRRCNDACRWEDFSACMGNDCEEGETRDCYDGPPGTAEVGVCRVGVETCRDGRWSACDGQVGPTAEVCDDGEDNDCDGATDADDDDCEGGVGVGDPCEADEDCGPDFACLRPPADPGFAGGYCGEVECEDECPGDAVCGRVFGRRYCLKPCARDPDCRTGYRCADAATADGGFACIPRCGRDADCADPALPRCDRLTGLCVPGGDAPDAGGPVDPPDPPDAGGSVEPFDAGPGGGAGGRPGGGRFPPPDIDAGPPAVSDPADRGSGGEPPADEGCSGCHFSTPGVPAGFWLLALGLLALRRRR